jgi:hypothetical protein
MVLDRSFMDRDREQLQRLRALVARLTDDDIQVPLGEGWTVGSTLAHLAFWDERARILLELWTKQGTGLSAVDIHVINTAALPVWRILTRDQVAKLVIEAAEAVEKQLETTPDNVIEWCLAQPSPPMNIERAKHRKEHIDQIEAAIKK